MSKLTWVKWLIYASAAFTLGMLAFIVGFIVWNGLGALSPSLFAWDYTTDTLSLTPALISTLITVGLSLAIATPIGVFTGFYLVEYADRKSRVVKVIRLATDTLAAVPSIVYGLFGMLFFVIYLRFQPSPISVVDQDVARMGETATAKLIAAINEKRQPEGEVLDTRYIPRMSTAHHLNEATP